VAHPSGARLGPYEISSLIGAGGMGKVYKARDTRRRAPDYLLSVLRWLISHPNPIARSRIRPLDIFSSRDLRACSAKSRPFRFTPEEPVMQTAVRIGLGIIVALMLAPRVASAQGTSAASITGVVKDASGGVLPGVTVEAASPALIERVRTAITDEQGQYRIIELRPGTYSVTFTLSGFSAFKREGLELPANFTATLNIELKVGALAETVTVSGESPLVDVQNVTQQKTVTKELLDAVPTGRATLAFTALMPAAVAPSGAQDVGGSKGETSVRMSIHGARQADQRLLQDGMSYNWLSGANGRSIYVNPLGAEEIVIDTGSGGSAEYSSGGAQINLIPRDGGNRFTASVFAAGTNHSLQENNLDADLQNRGLKSINGIQSIYDLNAVIAGPIQKDKLWFMSAHRRWGRRERIANLFYDSDVTDFIFTPDFNRPAQTAEDLRSDNLRLTWQATTKDKVTFSVDWQHNNANNQGGGVSTGAFAMEAIINPDAYCNRVSLWQSTWTHPNTSKLLFEAGATVQLQHRSFGFPDIACGGMHHEIAIRDSAEPLMGNFNYHGTGTQTQDYQTPANQRFSVSYLTGSHNFKFGMQALESFRYETETWRGSDAQSLSGVALPVSYVFRNRVPTSLTEFVTPRISNGQTRPNLGIFAQDQWHLSRVTLTVGLRYEYLHSYAPAIDQPAGFPIPTSVHFDELDCLPCWHDLSPRAAVAYDVFGNGKTAIKASIGRYVGLVQNALANTYAPSASVVASTTRSWTDSNGNFFPDCDLKNPAANLECGAMNPNTFGTVQIRTTPDPNWISGFGNRDDNWRASLSLDRELWPGAALNVGYYRASYGNFTVTDNTLVGPSDYDPYCVTAPVDSRLGRLSGSSICGLYDIKPAAFGNVNNVVTLASKFGKQTDVYNGADVNFALRLPRRASLAGGWNVGNSFATGNVAGITFGSTNACFVVDSPQQLFNCKSGNPYQNRFKLNGSLPLPKDVQVAFVYQNLPGAPYSANATFTTAQIAPSLGRPLAGATANVTIDLFPAGSHYLDDRINQLDFRASKIIRMNGPRFQANFDLYNVFNANTILSVNSTVGPAWLTPTAILDGRMAKFSFQIDF
jgi:hypothetical protein